MEASVSSTNPYKYGLTEPFESPVTKDSVNIEQVEVYICARYGDKDTFNYEHATDTKSSIDRKVKRPVKMPDDYDGKQPLWEYLKGRLTLKLIFVYVRLNLFWIPKMTVLERFIHASVHLEMNYKRS